MLRIGTLSLFGIILITFSAAIPNPPDDSSARIQKALAVQTAMARARGLLIENQPKKAVEVLEGNLTNVNGSGEYLTLLREAYRACIRDLHFTGQPDHAKKYLDRLCIIDPSAANDATLRTQVNAEPRKFEQPPEPKQAKTPFPLFRMPALSNPFVKKDDDVKPTARGVPDADDPFDPKHKRQMTSDVPSTSKAQDLLARGASEFKNERYAQARNYFEQAYQADQGSLDACRSQWAYCIIKGVSDSMDQPGAKLPELKQQVEHAIAMAPANLGAVGKSVLDQLEKKGTSNTLLVAASTKVKHWGQNKEGWQVAESKHFRIFHRKDNEYAERVAMIAEGTRAAMYRKWFENDGSEWSPVCELILHSTGSDYTHATGVPGNSPGHSRIETDPNGRVVARRMDLRMDIASMMEAVLPHETTHIVLAGMFGNSPVPRWADEGVAVLTEPEEKIDLHRRNLLKHQKDGQLFGLKELMELKDYPHPRRIGAFYSQSVVLAEYMTKKRGPKALTDFITDGVRYGYETALQRHYNLTFGQLEQDWQREVLSNTERYSARQ